MREVPITVQPGVIWSTDSNTLQDFMECLDFCVKYVDEYRAMIKVYYSRFDDTYKVVPEHMETSIKKDGLDLRVTFWKPL